MILTVLSHGFKIVGSFLMGGITVKIMGELGWLGWLDNYFLKEVEYGFR